ncbi:MAG TPA: universal stress protein [Solirubrobacteraceae bacterium]|nr:universal stress protein [Solirubrobacteraceae bacterium]
MSDELRAVLFAYDGSDLAKHAIEVAGRELVTGREAVVLTVWRTFNVGFIPVQGREFDAAATNEVREAAEETAAHGASLAEAAGFHAQSMAVNAAPAWKGIADVANEQGAGLIVLGSHGKHGLASVFAGSVAGEVAAHSPRAVLIVHKHA